MNNRNNAESIPQYGPGKILLIWAAAVLPMGIVGMYALPSRIFRSTWFGIIAHSGQSIFFAVLILGLVLGLA